MKHALVVGGSNGIGLALVAELSKRPDVENVYVLDKKVFKHSYLSSKIKAYDFDLVSTDYDFLNNFNNIDTLIITAGFGKLAHFKDISQEHIIDTFNVNTIGVIRIIKHFYDKLLKPEPFYCGVMVSIAGFMSSPLFSVYAASKAALKIFIESVNVELIKSGSINKILNVSPGSIKGTSFNSDLETDLDKVIPLAKDIIMNLENHNDLFIPQYEEIYCNVLERYHKDFRKEGLYSYDYKVNSGRLKMKY